jgi:hypothetical protein
MYIYQTGRLLDQLKFDLDYRMPEGTSRTYRAYVDRGLALDPNNEVLLTQLAQIEASSQDCRYSEIERVQSRIKTMNHREPALFYVASARLKQRDLKLCEGILYILENNESEVPRPAISRLRMMLTKAYQQKKAAEEPLEAEVLLSTPDSP